MKTRLLCPLPFILVSFVQSVAAAVLPTPGELTNHIYQAVSGTFTWPQAKADAESRGGHLATITSQAEFDYVRSLGVLPSEGYWLGATDEANPGVWVWVTGEPWSFTAWASGEPNSLGVEDYLQSSGSPYNHYWNNWTGILPFYILEIDPVFCAPRKAKATPQLVNGFVVGATITDSGCGYTNAPLVLIQGGGGTGATATAVITDGQVSAIRITSAGVGYDNPPRIVIASPPFVPTLTIRVSKVRVSQEVVLGRRYLLESSGDLVNWTATGPPFTAQSETIENEFDVDLTGRFFRVIEVP